VSDLPKRVRLDHPVVTCRPRHDAEFWHSNIGVAFVPRERVPAVGIERLVAEEDVLYP
jgi:hypothetical protein